MSGWASDRVGSAAALALAVSSVLAVACATAPGGGPAATPAEPPVQAVSTQAPRARRVPPPVQITEGDPDSPIDPIARLQKRLDAGELTLEYDSIRGYLPSVLAALDVPLESQGLVFSRTSLQTDRIAPWTPRALYFNDDVYIGWVQESPILEIASVDPDEGGYFYTLPQNPEGAPRFKRETTACLMCHESKTVTGGVPGFILLSVLTDRHGYVITNVHEGPTTERTPIAERWGGWYVTGSAAATDHSGNTMAPVLSHEVSDRARYLAEFDMTADAHATDLEGRFDTSPYLTPHSDIVALLVLAHQARVHNLITLAAQEAGAALREQEFVLRSSGQEPPADGFLPITRVRIDGVVERLVRGMLFVGEVDVGGPVTGTSGFAEQFQTRGPRDARGRSLRDFDLEHRVFRYPLSFLIYSDAFKALPELVRRTVYDRLDAILSGRDTDPDFAHLSAEDRAAIQEILTETQPEFLTLRTQ
ncbi:MAG: hypothetical protein R3E10_14350 [Gemmatimonadota bacterium]